MAGVSHVNHFPCNNLSVTTPQPRFSSKPSLFPVNLIGFQAGKISERSKVLIGKFAKSKPVLIVRAVTEDKWGEGEWDEDEWGEDSLEAAVAVEKAPSKELTETEKLKKQLVDSFCGTDRGLTATSETRAEIVELITQLESKNPTPAPTEALTLLNGKWILGYTSFAGLFPLLTRVVPLVKVEEISQTIDSKNFTVQNSVLFAGPFTTTSISTNAKFEARSPKSVQIKFEEGIIRTPQLTDDIVVPENVEFLGQKIDLTPFKGLFTSVQDTALNVAKTISSQPPLKFSIPNSNAESWLLTTYLDEDLRISRVDGGSVFVLIKEGSPLLTP